MAQVTYRVDDLDGKTKVTGDSTVLSLNGRTVSVDLSEKHVLELTALLAPYFENGTEVTKTPRKANGGNGSTDSDHNAEVRQWALSQGLKVSERGRLSAEVKAAYDKAHPVTDSEKDAA